MKELILVTSPPASGKTYISKQISRNLNHVVYLDKDSLIVLSKQIFAVAGEPYDRSSDFFEKNIRNYEYDAILEIGMEALEYDDIVLINAPFSREIRNKAYIDGLRQKLAERNAKLVIIWIITSVEVCRQRMIARNSDRDKWKLENWDEYIKGVNFSIPEELDDPECRDDLLLFYNSTEEEYQESMKRVLSILESE
ncbi:AAA family ATPase [Anaerolentibacter hominis]|uniref:AAA family ATPase n=1 Tax=Anaerolentibacter hominis TaxID=3079009 RepID=UPI0031B80EB1